MTRFTRRSPCPICEGYDQRKRGEGERCFGYLDTSGQYAHCTRDELRGQLGTKWRRDDDTTWVHFLGDSGCECGHTHGSAPVAPAAPAAPAVVYTYTDEQGVGLFQVVRRGDGAEKKIHQRPVVNGKPQTGGLGDTRRVLYRLPQVIAAAAKGEGIYVAEGEKDVHALERAGVVATCNPMGAGKWRPEFAESLRGASGVVIVADRDGPGRKHAAAVAESVGAVVGAAAVRVVEAAEGHGAADHLDAGRTLDEFVTVDVTTSAVETEKSHDDERTITTRPLSDYVTIPVDWLMRGYIPAGELTVLAGDGGLGKSTLCATVGADVTRGRLAGLVGSKVVLVVLGEDDPARVSRARHAAANAVMERVYILAANEGAGEEPITLPDDLDRLREAIEHLRPDLVVIDPLAVHLAGTIDYFRDGGKGGMRVVLNPLSRLAQTTGVTIIVAVHLNKGTGAASSRIGGTAAIRNAARNVLMLVRHPEAIGDNGADDGRRILGHDKCNYGGLQPSLSALVRAVPIMKADGTPLLDKDGSEATTSRLTLGEASDVGYEEGLRAASAGPSEASTALTIATDFVKTELKAGAMPSTQLSASAKAAGISARTLDRARARLGVLPVKSSKGTWCVSLPEHPHKQQQQQMGVGDDY